MFLLLLLILPTLGPTESHSTGLVQLAKIISQLPNYHAVFHHDGTELESLESLIDLGNDHPIYLINYKENTKDYELSRNRHLHIILLGTTQLERYELFDSLHRYDIAIILSEMKARTVCEHNYVNTVRTVFVMGLSNASFSRCCFYCGANQISVRTIQTNNHSEPKIEEWFSNFRNFHGYRFRIGYGNYAPFFVLRHKDKTFRTYGPESRMIAVSQKVLNFEFTFIQYFSNATDSVTDIMSEEVHLGNLDWAVGGISQTVMRTKMKNLEFSRFMQFQSYMAVYMKNDENFVRQLVQFWYVSNWRSFLLIAAGVLATASVAKLSLMFSRKAERGFNSYAIMAMFYTVEQPSSRFNKNMDLLRPYVKLLFVFWLFICASLTVNYKTIQAYFLMTSQTGPKNLEELITNGYRLQMEYDDFASLKLHCEYLSSNFCNDISNKLEVFKTDTCFSIRQVLKGKVALIQEEEPLKYTALKLCNLTFSQKTSLRFASAPIIPNEWHAWPFQKSAPYIDTFSRLISRMESSGLLQHWYKKDTYMYSHFYLKIKTQWREEPRSLNISDFLYPFVILISGYIISLILYFMELYNFKHLWTKLELIKWK